MTAILKESDRPDLDTLSSWCIRLACRIRESAVSDKLCSVWVRVVRLQRNDLIRSHIRKVIPLVLRIMSHNIILASAFAITEVQLEEVVLGRASDVAHGQLILLHLVEWLPDIEKGNTSRQEVIGFILHKLLHPHRAGFSCVIAMYKTDRCSLRCIRFLSEFLRRIILRSNGVIEDEDSLRALSLLQELDDLRVELLAHELFILPLVGGILSGEVVDGKAFLVNRELLRLIPGIVDLHLMRIISGLMNAVGLLGFVEIELGQLRLDLKG